MRALFFAIAIVSLPGCVAVWGGAHNVVRQDENGITFEYDPMFTSSARMQALPAQHCERFVKAAQPVSAGVENLTLSMVEMYRCVPR